MKVDPAELAESALGYRVAKIGEPHEYSSGYQIQWRSTKQTKDGPVKVVDKVVPGSQREYDMFALSLIHI